MQKTSQTQEVHLRPNVRKSVFYLSDQYNQVSYIILCFYNVFL